MPVERVMRRFLDLSGITGWTGTLTDSVSWCFVFAKNLRPEIASFFLRSGLDLGLYLLEIPEFHRKRLDGELS